MITQKEVESMCFMSELVRHLNVIFVIFHTHAPAFQSYYIGIIYNDNIKMDIILKLLRSI